MKRSAFFWIIFLASSLSACGRPPSTADSEKKEVYLTDPWIRMVPPTSVHTAGYGTLHNPTDQAIQLIGASCEIAKEVKPMITTRGPNHQMGMALVDQLTIPAGKRLELKPGGDHLMFLNLKHHPQEEEEVPVQLRFKSGASLLVHFKAMRHQANRINE